MIKIDTISEAAQLHDELDHKANRIANMIAVSVGATLLISSDKAADSIKFDFDDVESLLSKKLAGIERQRDKIKKRIDRAIAAIEDIEE